MPTINHTLRQTREEAFKRAKARGEEKAKRAILLEIHKEDVEEKADKASRASRGPV